MNSTHQAGAARRACALRNQHRECQRCKARGLIVTEGDRREDGSVVNLTVHHVNRVRERPDLALMEYTPGAKEIWKCFAIAAIGMNTTKRRW